MRTSFFLITLFVAGCGGQPDPKDMGTTSDIGVSTVVPTNFASINSELLQPTCTFSVCHSPQGKLTADALDLKDDGSMTPGLKAYLALVNQMSVNKKALAMGLLRVKPCDSAHSFLQLKLAMTADTDKDSDFGHHMPDLAGEFLTAPQLKAFKDWIDRGAIMDEPANVSGSTCQLGQDMGPQHD